MVDSIDATGSLEEIAGQLTQASDELEHIESRNEALRQEFENHQWAGLDQLTQARTLIAGATDSLTDVSDKVGLAAEVRDARRDNEMATYASNESLGRA